MEKTKFHCPQCGGKLKVWVDVNTSVEYSVSSNGTLSKRTVVTSSTGEPRYGINCNECDWGVYGDDDDACENTGFMAAIEQAADKTAGIQFSVKRSEGRG